MLSFRHGPQCNAVTWPTKCPGCSDRVFFFRCDCGSKVFFDDLGPPWPIHDCEISWTRNLIRTRHSDGSIVVEISEGVSIRRAPDSFAVESAVTSRVTRKNDNDEPIVPVNAEDSNEDVTITGLVREKLNRKDVFSTLDVKRGTLGSEMIEPLSEGEWGKITIHVPSPSNNKFLSYTFWALTSHITCAKNKKGVTAQAQIRSLKIPNKSSIWVCTCYEVLG